LIIELGLLFLLLPIAAASGWWMAKRNQPEGVPEKHAGFTSEYFTGLNFLLNEQPDKAVDVFIKMLEVDSETVETHLALGNLFRRRGEGDRAIRIHQNLIARPTLTKQQRSVALFELGKDYMRAGFLDRAENLFLELVDNRDHKKHALENLLDIYQQERDWEKSIMIAQKLESHVGKRMNAITAQFCCEIAETAKSKGENKLALNTLKRALGFDKKCVRASIAIATIDQESGNYTAAIKSYKKVEQQDPIYLSEVIEPIFSCYKSMGKIDEMETYLNYVLKKYGGISPTLALAELTRLRHGEVAAAKNIINSLRNKPSVRGINRLTEFLAAASDGKARDNIQILKDLTSKLLEGRSLYHCDNCGFSGKTLHWQCPTCKAWDHVRPIKDGDGF
jgi:lipopolysaccharide biosynthesis regulator YciM